MTPYPLTIQYGQPFEGGFYGGLLQLGSAFFAIAWAPKSTQIKAAIGVEKANAFNYADSHSNTIALAEAGSPLAKAALAANINGHNDWLIPARDVLELAYRMLKPSKNQNFVDWNDGVNQSSAPKGVHYSKFNPTQTIAPDFLQGGSESFDLTWYWSSTLHSEGLVFWAAAGFDDTLLRWQMKPEVVNGEKKDIQSRVQIRGGQTGR